MIAKLITGGTTNVRGAAGATAPATSGRYYGFRLGTGAFTLTVHDAIGTAAAAAANQIDYAVHVASQPTLIGNVPGAGQNQGVGFMSGLQAVLTAAGTAVIFFE